MNETLKIILIVFSIFIILLVVPISKILTILIIPTIFVLIVAIIYFFVKFGIYPLIKEEDLLNSSIYREFLKPGTIILFIISIFIGFSIAFGQTLLEHAQNNFSVPTLNNIFIISFMLIALIFLLGGFLMK